MGRKQRGDGAAGGGLEARIRAWEALPGALITANRKHVTGHDPGNRVYTKPGSQNSRKGGRGKSQ